jgi:hypothetical protein
MTAIRDLVERAVWAVYGLLPASWSRGRRMFVSGLVLVSTISIPVGIIRILLGW